MKAILLGIVEQDTFTPLPEGQPTVVVAGASDAAIEAMTLAMNDTLTAGTAQASVTGGGSGGLVARAVTIEGNVAPGDSVEEVSTSYKKLGT